MSTIRSNETFTRKQKNFIYKIAFLEAMALSLIIPSAISAGEVSSITSCPASPPSPCPTQVQSNSFPCSFVSSSTCSHTTTFSPTYSITPILDIPTLQPPNTGLPISHIQVATVNFISVGNGTRDATWSNMPSGVVTELFGDTNHRQWVDFSGIEDMAIVIDCPVATTGIGYLVPQYSTDNGVTWLYFRTGTTTDDTTFDAFIDGVSSGQGNCGTGIPVTTVNFLTSFQTASHPLTPTTGAGQEYVRIAGFDLNAGDSPVFTQITVETFKALQVSCAPTVIQQNNIQFQINIICSDRITLSIQVFWEAYILA